MQITDLHKDNIEGASIDFSYTDKQKRTKHATLTNGRITVHGIHGTQSVADFAKHEHALAPKGMVVTLEVTEEEATEEVVVAENSDTEKKSLAGGGSENTSLENEGPGESEDKDIDNSEELSTQL